MGYEKNNQNNVNKIKTENSDHAHKNPTHVGHIEHDRTTLHNTTHNAQHNVPHSTVHSTPHAAAHGKKESFDRRFNRALITSISFVSEHGKTFAAIGVVIIFLIGVAIGRALPRPSDGSNKNDLFEDTELSLEDNSDDVHDTDGFVIALPDLEPEIPSGNIDTSDTSEVAETAETSDSPEIIPDTSWAYYIVNRSNPISRNFEDDIDFSPVWSNGRNYYFDSRITDYVQDMINDAASDGVTLLVCSAYRSYQRQSSNFENRMRSYASAKYAYSTAYALTSGYIAVPGTSEHQTGLAVDFITPGYMYLDDGFEDTDAYKWLSENCSNYGFILRYPSDKSELTGINYEPWHFRFIGFEHAKDITESGLCLEEYMEKDTNVNINSLTALNIPAEPDWYRAALNESRNEESSSDESVSDTEISGETDTYESDSSVEESVDSVDTTVKSDALDQESESETSDPTGNLADTYDDTDDRVDTADNVEETTDETNKEDTIRSTPDDGSEESVSELDTTDTEHSELTDTYDTDADSADEVSDSVSEFEQDTVSDTEDTITDSESRNESNESTDTSDTNEDALEAKTDDGEASSSRTDDTLESNSVSEQDSDNEKHEENDEDN